MTEPAPTVDYDRLAAAYARRRRAHPGVLAALNEAVGAEHLRRVLEIGCGTGNYLRALADLTDGRPFGLDPSRGMLAQAQAAATAIHLVAGRAESLPFAPATFDLAFSVDVIHHIGERAAHYREALRVLAPGGRICTVTDSAEDIARRRPLSAYFPETIAVELARYPSISTLRDEMANVGFAEITTDRAELAYDLHDLQPYRERAFSSLQLIADPAFQAGLRRMQRDLARGPIPALSLYTLVWARKPPAIP